MRRFLEELLDPIRKCIRVGHDFRIRPYIGYESPQRPNSHVLDSVEGKITFCRRCKFEHNRSVEHRKGIHSFTADRGTLDKILRKGFMEE